MMGLFGRTGHPTWDPTSISGCAIWLDALQESFSDDDAVGTWTDRSGNSNNATQATAGYKPTFKTNIIDSTKPVVRFDGADDYLTVAANATFQCAQYSVFVVCKVTPVDNWDSIYTLSDHFTLPEGNGIYCYDLAGTPCLKYWATIFNRCVTDYDGLDSAFHVFEVVYNQVVIAPFVDGVAQDTQSETGTALSDGTLLLGTEYAGSLCLEMDMAEFIYYDNAISAEDRALLEAYLTDKW